MKVVIVSDSHGDVSFLRDNIDLIKDADCLIHLGDYDRDVEEIRDFLPIRTIAVRGNNEFFSDQPYEKVVYLEGFKFFLTHGHKYGVYGGLHYLRDKALELEADFALFGHTHEYCEIDDDVIIINPGSCSLPRDGKKSFVILELDDLEVKVKRVI